MPSTVTDRIDGITTSAAVKTPVKILTTTPITLSGVQTLQGVLLTAYTGPGLPADRVCVNGQTDNTTNGIYLVQTGAWTREPDFDGPRDAVTGTLVSVLSGTYTGSLWELSSTANPIIIGTSAITFSQTSIGAFSATSTTSNTIGTGSKTFTTSTALPLPTGQFVVIIDSANSANFMHGQITSYVGTTLIINSLDVGGSGTKTSWNIYISSPQGVTGATGATGPTGAVGTTGSPANGNLTKFSGGTSITNGDLSGDATTSGTLALILATVNSNVGSFTAANITVNGKGLITAASNGSPGVVTVKRQSFTSSGTYTPSTGMLYCDVIAIGGGGGGGGVGNDTANLSGAGGSGSFSRGVLTAAQIGGSQTVTIGAAGTAGANTGGTGGTGGATSLGTLVTTNGGLGGVGSATNPAAGSPVAGGVGGAAATGDISIPGKKGSPGLSSTTASQSGTGADSLLGAGGQGKYGTISNAAGVSGSNYGAGGSGASATSAGQLGGAGTAGVMLIIEYCSQ